MTATTPAYRIEALSKSHRRGEFVSGADELDRYFREIVTQDMRRRVAACFVASGEAGEVAGYYTLAMSAVALADLPAEITARLPRYPTVPAVLLGRLAVARAHHGRKLGGMLLGDALRRSYRSEISAYAMIVDARDETAMAFYRYHGFVPFESRPRSAFLPLARVAAHILSP